MSLPATSLTPHKAVLLAARLACLANIPALTLLVAQHPDVLRRDLVLRILLTYLPETAPSSHYVGFLRDLDAGDLARLAHAPASKPADTSAVDGLSDSEAATKVRKLRLLRLVQQNASGKEAGAEAPLIAQNDEEGGMLRPFLSRRAQRVDEEAGLLTQLPGLLYPFAEHDSAVRTFSLSTLLPWLRYNCEYYPARWSSQSLGEFAALPANAAVQLLLAPAGEDPADVGRDLRSMIMPWLHNESRWERMPSSAEDAAAHVGQEHGSAESATAWACPGWESVLEWIVAQAQAPQNWRAAVRSYEAWMGPDDADLASFGPSWLGEARLEHLRRRYLRAGLASAYLVAEPSVEGLAGAYAISARLRAAISAEESMPLSDVASVLQPVSCDATSFVPGVASGALRNGLLKESSVLTGPGEAAVLLLQAVVVGAYLLARAGCPCSVRRAGELLLLGDQREQTLVMKSLVRAYDKNPLRSHDEHWTRARNELLWLRDWGQGQEQGQGAGIFGRVSKQAAEAEILNALLANSRLSLARSIYETAPQHPLQAHMLQDAVVAAAMHAYDNASNPNRTRGGLKKCDDIMRAFPSTVPSNSEAARRVEALLRATHALGEYRLVLKRGEPFSPVVLRVHSDPISIIGKVLEQNHQCYTSLQDFLDLGMNMIKAGLTRPSPRPRSQPLGYQEPPPDDQKRQFLVAERRIIAMCVEAALREDDFETAYSYVINRLEAPAHLSPLPSSPETSSCVDHWSWAAALAAGQYVRTSRSLRPTHIGTASGNPEVRHLEQRLECLATALRIAPASRLQEILETFRVCEEQLDSALRQEAAIEEAWDTAADMHRAAPLPGSFIEPTTRSASAPGAAQRTRPISTGDEAPMSLFGLSRATARIASQNLSVLSGLQRSTSMSMSLGSLRSAASDSSQPTQDTSIGATGTEGQQAQQAQQRLRKRDQLRDAAVGTLVSGVGWLVGAQPAGREQAQSQAEAKDDGWNW